MPAKPERTPEELLKYLGDGDIKAGIELYRTARMESETVLEVIREARRPVDQSRLGLAIEAATQAEKWIEPEQSRLRSLIEESKSDAETDSREYQIWYVQKYLTRAAEAARARRYHMPPPAPLVVPPAVMAAIKAHRDAALERALRRRGRGDEGGGGPDLVPTAPTAGPPPGR